MMDWDSFKGVTLRALRIDYISPQVCELISSGSSGSGSGESSVLDIVPVTRAAGPASLTVSVEAGIVSLTWTPAPGAYAYAVYVSSVSADGPFALQTSNVIGESFFYDSGPGTFWAKVTSLEPNFGESFPSPTVEFVV